ncbi:MAG: hypothetical protein PHW92_15440 [Lutibacter sp.]|nr:hypothetical protein [Lutibacter sp.]
MEACILKLLLKYIFSLLFTREFTVVCARVSEVNTTPLMVAYFALQNTKFGNKKRKGSQILPAFLPRSPLRAGNQPRQSEFIPQKNSLPAARSVKSGSQTKSFLFPLEEKIGAHKSKNVKKTFLLDSERRRGGFLSRGSAQRKFGHQSKTPLSFTLSNIFQFC